MVYGLLQCIMEVLFYRKVNMVKGYCYNVQWKYCFTEELIWYMDIVTM